MFEKIKGEFLPAAPMPEEAAGIDHYLGLDLLRGVAAIAVVFFHCNERFDLIYLCPHGSLAVDFFFVLSGFVIARAYYDRLSSHAMTLVRFAQTRLIRLMPLIILGTVIAAFLELGRPGNTDHHRHLFDTIQALFFGSILLPMLRPTVLQAVIFPLNGPAWSLFFEVIANAAFAFFAKGRAGIGSLYAALAVCGIWYASGIYENGTVDLGVQPNNILFGLARVGWSFTLGIILFRLRHRAPKVSFAIPFLLLILTLVAPVAKKPYDILDISCVFVVMPLIVWLASTVQFGVRGRRIATLSGELSYPLYAIHYPLLRVFTVVSAPFHLGIMGRMIVVLVTVTVVVTLSAAAYAFYDVPVRRWLTSKLIRGLDSRKTRPAGLK